MVFLGLGTMPCAICQIPHATLAICLLASAIKSFKYRTHALIAFHAIAGAILLFLPQLIHGPTVSYWIRMVTKIIFNFVFNPESIHSGIRTTEILQLNLNMIEIS